MAPVSPVQSLDSRSEFQRILVQHAARYPRMEAQDYGKLLFQNVFGPEHLLSMRSRRPIPQRTSATGSAASIWIPCGPMRWPPLWPR